MSNKIVIDPLTRVSGYLRIEVVIENNKVVDAKSVGNMFRGFETILKGRSPLDAIYFTERICGICSTAHSYVAALALENALDIKVTNQGKMMRDFIHGCEFLQNHIRHFYLYVLPDYIKGPLFNPAHNANIKDYRIPLAIEKRMSEHYMGALKYSAAAHEMLAMLGGKAPHNHGIYLGGVTENMSAEKYTALKEKLTSIKDFIDNSMLEDVYILSEYYKDYFNKGISGKNFLSMGLFDDYLEKGLFYVKPSVMVNGTLGPFDPKNINESIELSWYKDEKGQIVEDRQKEGAYSFVKAVRYNGESMEVGPLARMILSGDYKGGSSAMDRLVSRVLETKKIASIMEDLLERIKENYKDNKNIIFSTYNVPERALGVSFRDTTRGALTHKNYIEDKVVKDYDIITPSVWNMGPEVLGKGKGIVEKALIGTVIEDKESPIEIGRIVRSFDPCISCATHVYGSQIKDMEYNII